MRGHPAAIACTGSETFRDESAIIESGGYDILITYSSCLATMYHVRTIHEMQSRLHSKSQLRCEKTRTCELWSLEERTTL